MDIKKTYLVVVIAAIVVVLFFGNSMFFTIKPGERAVVFRKFGSGLDKEHVYVPGFHVIAPWNILYVYDVKEQKRDETMDILDKSGLSISMDVSVRFNPLYDRIGYLHEIFGKDYVNQLIITEVRSTVRRVAGRYNAEEIYSTKRAEVEASIEQEARDVLSKNNIDMRAMLIRSINLPAEIKSAIENKLKQEQESLAYVFRLQKEKSEAERKRIEAEGIAAYNDIINASLTDRILKQRGIEATLELSASPNAKVVVIGSGKEGMPLILGGN
jgi:regulator of protease activity HflC (stomatin/prohibitin superfamily)